MTIEQEPHGRKPSKKNSATSAKKNAGTAIAEGAAASPSPAIRFTGGADAAAAVAAEAREVRTDDITPSSNNLPHREPDAEMIASVRDRGVIEPPLLRRIPGGAVVTDASGAQRTVHFEIVFGECRWKAAVIAGLRTLLCIVRELTDAEALDLQTEENLQRKNLDPIQEASVFELYQRRGADITTIAARVHKSERHVAQRLKLLELADAEKAALILGKILLGTALELASLPKDLSQQDRDAALMLVMPGDSVLTVKEARARLTRRFYLRMAVAPFSTEDATLVPEAGSCMTCPKRTGTQMALTIDGLDNEDRCSDAACWSSKELATWRRKTEEASAKGIRVLDALSTNKATVDQAYKVINEMRGGALVSLDAPCDDLTDAEEAAAEKANEEALESGDEDAINVADARLNELARRKKPTWREMLGGDVTPAAILRNRFYEAGKETTGIVELVDHRGALETIKAKGATLRADALAELAEPTRGPAEDQGNKGGRDERDEDLHAGQRLRYRAEKLFAARLREVLVERAEKTPPRPGMGFWRALIGGALEHAIFDTISLRDMFEARGWAVGEFHDLEDEDIKTLVMTRAEHMTEPALRGLLVDVLCCLGEARIEMSARLEVDEEPLKAETLEAAKAEATKDLEKKPGACRACGCTEDSPCVENDGGPCSWVEPDLCSVCEGTAAAKKSGPTKKKKKKSRKADEGASAGASS